MTGNRLGALAAICVMGVSTSAHAQSEQSNSSAEARISRLSDEVEKLKSEVDALKSQIAAGQKGPAKNDIEQPAPAATGPVNNVAAAGGAAPAAGVPSGSATKENPRPTGIANAAIPASPASDKSTSAGAQLVTSQASNIASLSFNHSFGRDSHGNIGTLSIVASTPIATGSDSTNLYSFDGLSNGSKIGVGYTLFHVTPPKILQNNVVGNSNDLYAGNWSIGINAAASYITYTYYPISTLAKTTENRVPWNLGGTFSYFPSAYSVLAFSSNYTKKFIAANSVVTCPVSLTKSTVTCTSGPISPPALSSTGIMSAEYRQLIFISDNRFIKDIGVAPKFSYDVVAHTYEFDGPVYLVPDSSGNLTGGINLQYLSKTNSFSVGIFIGTKFSTSGIGG